MCSHGASPSFEPQAETRRCGRCQQSKPLDEFAWRRKARGQRDNYCRPCRADYKQAHYAANRERYIANALRRKQQVAAQRMAYLIEYFVLHPCVDCGETDPLVLELTTWATSSSRSGRAFGIATGRACWPRSRSAKSFAPTAIADGRRLGAVPSGLRSRPLARRHEMTIPRRAGPMQKRATGLEPVLRAWKAPVQPLTPRPRARVHGIPSRVRLYSPITLITSRFGRPPSNSQ